MQRLAATKRAFPVGRSLGSGGRRRRNTCWHGVENRLTNKLVPELFQPLWAASQAGESLTDASAAAETQGDESDHRKAQDG